MNLNSASIAIVIVYCMRAGCSKRIYSNEIGLARGRREQNVTTGNASSEREDGVQIKFYVYNNLFGLEIEDMTITHRHASYDHPTIIERGRLRAGSRGGPYTITTNVGFWAWRKDWWLITLKLRRGESGSCAPFCEKEDGSCATLISNAGNYWEQFFTDPMTYVKAGVLTANIAAAVASHGTTLAAGIALGGSVTDAAAEHFIKESSDFDTLGFFSASLKTSDWLNSRDDNIPFEININPTAKYSRMIEKGRNFHSFGAEVRFKFFKEHSRTEIRDEEAKELVPMPCDATKQNDDKGHAVTLYFRSSAYPLKSIVFLHRNLAFTNSMRAVEHDARVGYGWTRIGSTRTVTGFFGFHHDWWFLAWMPETINGHPNNCVVKASTPEGMVQKIIAMEPGEMMHAGVATAGNRTLKMIADSMHGSMYGVNAIDTVGHFAQYHRTNSAIRWIDMRSNGLSMQMLGKELAFHLSVFDKTVAFKKCNLGWEDVRDGARAELIERGGKEYVQFQYQGLLNSRDGCEAEVISLRCLDEPMCRDPTATSDAAAANYLACKQLDDEWQAKLKEYKGR